MKTLVLVLALMVVVAGAAMAEPVTFDIYQGWNMIAVPTAPFSPAVPDVLKTTEGIGIPVLDCLSTFDTVSGSDYGYNAETAEWYPGMNLGTGYWLWYEGDVNPDTGTLTLQYDGFPNGLPDTAGGPRTDMWISLPGSDFDGDGVCEAGNWHMIGNPYAHYVDIGVGGVNIKFTDGNEVKTWSEACAEPGAWVSSNMVGFLAGSDLVTGFAGGDQTPCLVPGCGYWLWTNRPNLAMIIDANAEYVF